jgi:hypothetical protein
MSTQINQLLSSLAFSIPVAIIFANAAHGQAITPMAQPDCAQVVCTQDGAALPKPIVTTTITPQATIIQVCRPNSCSFSWVGHETNETAIGNEPQVFVIPAEDRK